MSSPASDPKEYDLRFLEAGLLDLEGYLLSKEIYWPIGASAPPGGPPYPHMTLGNLLLSQARLNARNLAPGHTAERLYRRLMETRQRWLSAWRQKARREFGARLNLWRDYLGEYREDPSGNIDRYAYEVNRRVLLALLEPEADSIPSAEREMLTGLDTLLRAVFVTGPFAWDPGLEAGFPAQKYWYLYGRPKS